MIGVIGLGFVGLTTAVGFAHKGYDVYGYDVDAAKTEELAKGVVPFHEPSLQEFMVKYRGANLHICRDMERIVQNCTTIFFCVGTPCKEDGGANLVFLERAVTACLSHIGGKDFRTFVVKSTVPPSTTADFVKPLIERYGLRVGIDVGLANNPEFLREGFAWDDFISPDRIVIGEHDKRSGEAVEQIYKSFDAPVLRVSLNTAEYIKYLSNSFLANVISFSNEMAMIADTVGDIDIPTAFRTFHKDKRWTGSPAQMTSYVYPGCGFGGYCLPKDTAALCSAAQDKGFSAGMLKNILTVNERIKRHFAEKIMRGARKNAVIGVLGLAFKPLTDDVRESPAKDIIEHLLREGYDRIIAYDPMAVDNFKNAFGLPIQYAASFDELAEKSEIIAVLTAWNEFKESCRMLSGKKIIDGRFFL